MFTAFGWVVFGMAVWALCIFMTALQRRIAPEMGDEESYMGSRRGCGRSHRHTQRKDPRDAEIETLKKRIETLEAIVTDRKYQWEKEFERS